MKITTEEAEGGLVIHPEGRLDTLKSGAFEKEVMSLIQQATLNVLIDFEKIDYISSAGIRSMLNIAKELKKKGKSMVLCCLNKSIKEVFCISGLDSIISIYATIEDGLISLKE